jgi:hypothetical protein
LRDATTKRLSELTTKIRSSNFTNFRQRTGDFGRRQGGDIRINCHHLKHNSDDAELLIDGARTVLAVSICVIVPFAAGGVSYA